MFKVLKMITLLFFLKIYENNSCFSYFYSYFWGGGVFIIALRSSLFTFSFLNFIELYLFN